MSKSKELRKSSLLQILDTTEMIRLSELAARLNVSEMTTRRYIAEIGDRVRLVGSYAFLVKDNQDALSKTYRFEKESERNAAAKDAIGMAAAKHIHENDIIFFDCGTTTPYIVKHLDKNIDFTAICCSMNIFSILQEYKTTKLFLTGGSYHAKTDVFSGRNSLELIRSIRITKAFISAAGVHKDLGLTCCNQYETDLKKEVVKYSRKVFLVADKTKFGEVTVAYFGDIEQVDAVFTDHGVSRDVQTFLDARNIEIIEA